MTCITYIEANLHLVSVILVTLGKKSGGEGSLRRIRLVQTMRKTHAHEPFSQGANISKAVKIDNVEWLSQIRLVAKAI